MSARGNYQNQYGVDASAPVKKKVVKPVTAGKAFGLGLLASFILLLIFSVGLIMVAMMRSNMEAAQYAQILSDVFLDYAFFGDDSVKFWSNFFHTSAIKQKVKEL